MKVREKSLCDWSTMMSFFSEFHWWAVTSVASMASAPRCGNPQIRIERAQLKFGNRLKFGEFAIPPLNISAKYYRPRAPGTWFSGARIIWHGCPPNIHFPHILLDRVNAKGPAEKNGRLKRAKPARMESGGKLGTVRPVEPEELASVVRRRPEKVLVIDSRSFLDFNTCHVANSVNVCCSKIVKRRLQQDKVSVTEFLTYACHIEADDTYDVIVYDQSSVDAGALVAESFVFVLLKKLAGVFKSVGLLKGGFLGFQASYPRFCEDKTRKCPPLSSVSQPCLSTNSGPTRILPFLYLGSQQDAIDEELLKVHNITYELNVSANCPKPDFIQDSHFMRIAVNDSHCDKLLPYFYGAFQFIDKVYEANGCVLIHCLAGISRSPTVAIAYVMRHLRMNSDDAYRYVKEKRATISPNFNFLGQLLEFEMQLRASEQSPSVQRAADPVQPRFQGCGNKRRCYTDMRSPASRKMALGLPTTFLTTLQSSPECSPTEVRSPSGDLSPTTAFAKLSFAEELRLNAASEKPAGAGNLTANKNPAFATARKPRPQRLGDFEEAAGIPGPPMEVEEEEEAKMKEEKSEEAGKAVQPEERDQAFREDGLYRARSCPGILGWLERSSQAATTLLALGFRPPGPRDRTRDRRAGTAPASASRGSRASKLLNRYSCGSLDHDEQGFSRGRAGFDSCPDFRPSASLELGGSPVDVARSPSHRPFNSNVGIIQVS